MTKHLSIGNEATWQWRVVKLSGTVKEVHHQPTSKTIKGKEIHRNGSNDNPAYFIKRANGNTVLKLHSELIL